MANRIGILGHIARLGQASRLLAGASLLAVPALPAVAHAQSKDNADASSDDGAIIVTAQRRQELSRDVPLTVTTANEAQLKASNVVTMLDLPKIATGVRFDRQGPYTQPVIRGIGNTIAYTAAGNSVGIYVDGFYVPNTLAIDFDFLNVKNIQVLKGPQGTLFGRNSTAGAILVTTAEPEFKTQGMIEASYERFNAKKIQAYVTAPLSSKVAFSLEGLFADGDGFNRNIYNGSLLNGQGFDTDVTAREKAHPDAYRKWTVRGTLMAELSNSATILLRYEHADKHDPSGQVASVYSGTVTSAVNGLTYTGPLSAGASVPGALAATERGQVSLNEKADFRIKTDVIQLTGRFDLGPVNLTSFTQYRRENLSDRQDSDLSSASIFALSLPEKASVFTQELLLSSKPGGRLQYTAGLFFYAGKNDTDVTFVFPPPTFIYFSANGAKLRTYAAYADVTYQLTDKLFITGGLRYSHDEVKDAYGVKPFQAAVKPYPPSALDMVPNYSDNHVTPRVVLRYKPSEESSIYASFTKGYKSAFPDANRTNAICGDRWYVCPESMNAYEIGAKYAKGGFTVDLAGFWYDYSNLQYSYYTLGAAVYSNAAKSRIKGIDAAVHFEPVRGLELSAAGTYLDAKYLDYNFAGGFFPNLVDLGGGKVGFAGFHTDPVNAAEAAMENASGNQVARAPKFTATFGVRYSTDLSRGRLVLSSNLYHSSRVYFDPLHQFTQKAYDILSARAEWTDPSGRFTFAVYGDNLLDTKYINQAYGTFNVAPAGWGRPATYGVSLRYNFGG